MLYYVEEEEEEERGLEDGKVGEEERGERERKASLLKRM
jgi:hypothetical protein